MAPPASGDLAHQPAYLKCTSCSAWLWLATLLAPPTEKAAAAAETAAAVLLSCWVTVWGMHSLEQCSPFCVPSTHLPTMRVWSVWRL